MSDVVTWMSEYSPPIALTLMALAACIFVLQKAVEKAIENSFEQRKKELELSLERRSTFWEKVLTDRYLLITGLLNRMEKVTTNLNRRRHGLPVPDGFNQGKEIVPLTEIFEDIATNRLLLGDQYHDLFVSLAQNTLSIANARGDSDWQEVGAKREELLRQLREAADRDFHISRISFESPRTR